MGDWVLISEYAGYKFKGEMSNEEEELLLVKESEVLAKLTVG